MRSIYAKSRDNARTPMQWNAEENAGFTSGNAVDRGEPELCGDQCGGGRASGSGIRVYSYYRRLTRLREKNTRFLLTAGSRLLMEEDEPDLRVHPDNYGE